MTRGAISDHPQSRVVLAVDDEVLVLDLIETALVEGGFEVLTATAAADAIALVESNRCRDIIALVTDVNMGRISGWDVAKRARELNPGLPVIYVSGDSGHEWASHGVPNSQIIQKPFAAAQLITAVAGLINAAQTSPMWESDADSAVDAGTPD